MNTAATTTLCSLCGNELHREGDRWVAAPEFNSADGTCVAGGGTDHQPEKDTDTP